jgi:hypothetical protein
VAKRTQISSIQISKAMIFSILRKPQIQLKVVLQTIKLAEILQQIIMWEIIKDTLRLKEIVLILMKGNDKLFDHRVEILN